MSPCAPLTLQHPLSPELAGALMALAARLDGRRWFLIGAGARDLLLAECPHARQPLRRTRDLDLAVAVSGWDEYAGLRARLLMDDRFAGTGQPQRLLFQQHLPVDLVPWGHQDANGSIAWPPDFAVRMSVIGYDEAYAANPLMPAAAGPDERLDCARRLLQAYADGITDALPHIDPAHGRT